MSRLQEYIYKVVDFRENSLGVRGQPEEDGEREAKERKEYKSCARQLFVLNELVLGSVVVFQLRDDHIQYDEQ